MSHVLLPALVVHAMDTVHLSELKKPVPTEEYLELLRSQNLLYFVKETLQEFHASASFYMRLLVIDGVHHLFVV